MSTRKKATTMLLKTLVGAVLGIMMLVFLLLLIRPYLSTTNNQQQQAFSHFAESIQSISKAGEYTGEKILLYLKEDSILLGFNAKENEQNGRFGNGEFYYAVKEFSYLINTEAFTEHSLFLDRADITGCQDEETCLCLCNKPSTIAVIQEEITQRTIDTTKLPNPYKEQWVKQEETTQFTYTPDDYALRKLTCKELTCTPLPSTTFLTTTPCGCFPGEQETCDYSFENGFAIHRRKNAYELDGVTLAYEKKLPENVQVNLEKLPNGAVGVALQQACLTQLEEQVR